MRFKNYRSRKFEGSLHAEALQRLGKEPFKKLVKKRNSWLSAMKWAIYRIVIIGAMLVLGSTMESSVFLNGMILLCGLWMGSSWWSRLREQHEEASLYHLPVSDEKIVQEATRVWSVPVGQVFLVTVVFALSAKLSGLDGYWFVNSALELVVSLLLSLALSGALHIVLPWRFKFLPFFLTIALSFTMLVAERMSALIWVGERLPWRLILEGKLGGVNTALVGVGCLAFLTGCFYYLKRQLQFDHYQMQEFLGDSDEFDLDDEEVAFHEVGSDEPVGWVERMIWKRLSKDERWLAKLGGLCKQNYVRGLVKWGALYVLLSVVAIEIAHFTGKGWWRVGAVYFGLSFVSLTRVRGAELITPWFDRRMVSMQSVAPLFLLLPVDLRELKGLFLKVLGVKAVMCAFLITMLTWLVAGVFYEWQFAGFLWLSLFFTQTLLCTVISEGLSVARAAARVDQRMSENRNMQGRLIKFLCYLIGAISFVPYWPLVSFNYFKVESALLWTPVSIALGLSLLGGLGLLVRKKLRDTRKDLMSEMY